MKFRTEDIFATLARLAAAPPRRRRITKTQQRRMQAGARRARRARQMRARVEALARQKNARTPRGRTWRATQDGRMVMVMEPGAWYGRKDIMAMTGLGRSPAAGVMARLIKAGLLERVNNPAYRGTVPPQRAMVEDVEPLYLYRLSELGVARQREEKQKAEVSLDLSNAD